MTTRHLPRFLRRACAALTVSLPALVAAIAPGGEPPSAGKVEFVEFERGQLPIILTVPHGGSEKPPAFKDRREGNTNKDRNSLELARAIADEFARRTGHGPHLIASLLHRVKLDPNRDLAEAAQGDPGAERVWRRFQACVDWAKRDAVAAHGFAFLVDVHGHGHPIARIELGYALYSAEINQSDAQLDAGDAGRRSSLGHLQARSRQGIAALLRGPASLGAFLEQQGVAVIPAPGTPRPLQDPYYSGTYILRHHASAEFAHVDGVQLECPFPGIRDTAAHRAAFARAFVNALAQFLERHYDYKLPAAASERRG